MTSANHARASAVAIVVGLAATLDVACAGGQAARRTFEFRGPTMGTTYAVKIVAGPDGLDDPARDALDRAIRDELDRINALMSTWDPGSELSRFNQSTSLEPVALSADTFEVLRWALEVGTLTGGALDVTIAPLVDAWGFGPGGQREQPPDVAEVARLREAVGTHHLVLDVDARTARKARPDVECDLSSLAPGHAADRIGALLAARGIADFLVDVGGELLARGRNDVGAPWQIAIERPQAGGRFIARTVPLSDRAIATSGDYRNYYEMNGERIAHILDPRTGRPIRHRLASVSVIDDRAIGADALSTALMVLGPDEGFLLAERIDAAALFIVRDDDGGFMERATRRFDTLTRP